MSKGWDSGMLKKLKSLVGKGLSTAEMGKKLGLSKNAVVGKLNRLGWNSKASDVEETKSTKTKNAPKSAKATAKKSEPKAKKAVAKKVVAKKVALKQKPATKVAAPKKVAKKADSKPAKTAKKEVVVEKTAIKTASKKTKKDLALHELLIQHALQMANLKPNQCRWPIGDPDSDNFHFCGETVFSGKPYCYEHCRQAYQFTPAKKNK
jgi:GcrA cell cycle regulator